MYHWLIIINEKIDQTFIFIIWWLCLKFLKFRSCGNLSRNFPLSALIACNAMNWPGGTAIYFSHIFHHWLMLYTFGQYIVNVQWSITGDRFLTIFKFGIRVIFSQVSACPQGFFVWCHFLSGSLVPCSFWGSLCLVPCSLGGGRSLWSGWREFRESCTSKRYMKYAVAFSSCLNVEIKARI